MFGKNPENKAAVVPHGGYGGMNFHQKATLATTRPANKGQSFVRWSDQFQPDLHQTDLIRLIPGNYDYQFADDSKNIIDIKLPWKQFREHFHGVFKKSANCSAGPLVADKNRATPCHGCERFWEEYRIRQDKKARGDKTKGPRTMSMTDKFAYGVLVQAIFHKVDDTDDKGNVKINNHTNKPYFSWQKCQGNNCQYCQMGIETKDGHVQPWPMGKQHFETLNAYAEYIGQGCITCGGRQVIQPVMWQCPNTECGDLIVDLGTTTMSPDQLKQLTRHKMTCKNCREQIFPEEVFECTTCTPAGQIPVRASVFDVDMEVRRQASNDPNSKATTLIIPAYSDPKPVDEKYVKLMKALNLDSMYGPTTLERQKIVFQVMQGQGQQQQGQQQGTAPPPFQPYGQQQQGQQPQGQPQTQQGQPPHQPPRQPQTAGQGPGPGPGPGQPQQ